MRVADDERARVPFALVGVVLLVGSATLAATMAQREIPGSEPVVGTAIEKAMASTHATVHQAADRAATEAGRNPLVVPTNGSYGRVFNDSSPFRDYLRVRIYLAVDRALDRTEAKEGGVLTTPSVPDVSNERTLREAKHRVVVESVGENESAGLRVRIRNVTLTTRQDGRIIDRRTITPTVVVSSPVLALHARTERYEERLNRGPLDGPGLGRRLTARTYALAWVRGYAQHGGAPIENVVANRHVELMTNGAILREQRAAFGHSDAAGRRAMGRATAKVALTDLVAGSRLGGDRWVQYLLQRNASGRGELTKSVPELAQPDAPREHSKTAVGVNHSADAGFSRLVDGRRSSNTLNDVLASAYSVDVKVTRNVRRTGRRMWTTGSAPSGNWTLVGERTETRTQVRPASNATVTSPAGWDQYRSYSRTVVRTQTTTRRWQGGNQTHRTQRHRRTTYRVEIGLFGKPARGAPGPSREIASLYERGGPLDGPNMRDVPEKAVTKLIRNRGGPDELARRALAGTLDTGFETVHARQPSGLSAWVYADLVTLREEVRNVSVSVDRRAVGTGKQRPAMLLRRALSDRLEELVEAPDTYGSAAARARAAARAAYLERVLHRLDARAKRSQNVRTNFERELSAADLPSLDRIERISAARDVTTPARSPILVAGPNRNVAISVAAQPSYLTLGAIDVSEVDSQPSSERYHPLVARNVNVFTVPYGDAADGVADGLFAGFDRRRVSLRTAARTLQAANRTLERRDDPQLSADRNELQTDVEASLEQIRRRLMEVIARESSLDRLARREAIDDGLAVWNGTDGRALAISNGSAAAPLAAAVVERLPESEQTDNRRDWIALRIRVDLMGQLQNERVRPPQRPVNRTGTRTRQIARTALKSAVENGLKNASERAQKRWFGKALAAVPAGLPLTPVPGHWYATANVWHVEVGGTYATFTVRARHGTPMSSSDATVAYTRTNRTVRLDVDGDGTAELLGRNEPVSFRTQTVVLVVVPPYGRGVGDVDGNGDERSPGWPNGRIRERVVTHKSPWA